MFIKFTSVEYIFQIEIHSGPRGSYTQTTQKMQATDPQIQTPRPPWAALLLAPIQQRQRHSQRRKNRRLQTSNFAIQKWAPLDGNPSLLDFTTIQPIQQRHLFMKKQKSVFNKKNPTTSPSLVTLSEDESMVTIPRFCSTTS